MFLSPVNPTTKRFPCRPFVIHARKSLEILTKFIYIFFFISYLHCKSTFVLTVSVSCRKWQMAIHFTSFSYRKSIALLTPFLLIVFKFIFPIKLSVFNCLLNWTLEATMFCYLFASFMSLSSRSSVATKCGKHNILICKHLFGDVALNSSATIVSLSCMGWLLSSPRHFSPVCWATDLLAHSPH